MPPSNTKIEVAKHKLQSEDLPVAALAGYLLNHAPEETELRDLLSTAHQAKNAAENPETDVGPEQPAETEPVESPEPEPADQHEPTAVDEDEIPVVNENQSTNEESGSSSWMKD